jgi:carboxypeptidase PM20D1
VAEGAAIEHEPAVERFRTLLRVPTISRADESVTEWDHFTAFIELLPRLYPAVHRTLTREIVGGYSMLYRWRGSGDSNPAVLMAHYDVVAAEDDGWEHPPFEAEVIGEGDDRVLWGRGTLDDKGALVALLEAVEAAVEAGFTPRNDIYLSFGHDEEIAGSGAAAIVSLLRERGIRPALVLDEGGAIVEGIFPGVTDPIAVVGVTEKGIAQIRLSVDQLGGHASTPPKTTATVRLSRAVTRLNAHPFPARLSETNLQMITTLGAHAEGPLRALFTRARLFDPVLRVIFGSLTDETRALVRTTTAVTQLSAGLAPNALAESATATVNTRIAVGSSIAATLRHFRRVIRDPLVRIEVEQAFEPSPVSPTAGPEWETIQHAITATHGEAIVTPYVMLAASDARQFTAISDAVYRFTPFEMSSDERATLHARNERMHVRTWLRGIDFYAGVIADR